MSHQNKPAMKQATTLLTARSGALPKKAIGQEAIRTHFPRDKSNTPAQYVRKGRIEGSIFMQGTKRGVQKLSAEGTKRYLHYLTQAGASVTLGAIEYLDLGQPGACQSFTKWSMGVPAIPMALTKRHKSRRMVELTFPKAHGEGSAVILLGVLAVHSVLEMMALGLADLFGESALLTFSIALHQVSSCGTQLPAMNMQGRQHVATGPNEM
jgi:hypothetical protein